jgi:hypothetical protein
MFFTAILAVATIILGGATVALYFGSEKQIALARDDFNATHRPWLPLTNAALRFGLKWVQGNALIGIDVFCINSGSSPARRVSLVAEIFPFLVNESIPKEMARIQAAHRSEAARGLIEHTVFPGVPGTIGEFCLSDVLMIPFSKLADLKDGLGDPATEIVPVIVGSIEYYFSFGEPTPHYTPFVYHVWRSDAQRVVQEPIQLDGKNLQHSEMILVPLINAGDPT